MSVRLGIKKSSPKLGACGKGGGALSASAMIIGDIFERAAGGASDPKAVDSGGLPNACPDARDKIFAKKLSHGNSVVFGERAAHGCFVFPSGDGEAAQPSKASDNRNKSGFRDKILHVLSGVRADALFFVLVCALNPCERDDAGRFRVTGRDAHRVAEFGEPLLKRLNKDHEAHLFKKGLLVKIAAHRANIIAGEIKNVDTFERNRRVGSG